VVPPESDDNLRLEIGHVLFIDIVDYSKLLNEGQKERLNQLTEIVLATTTVREATDEQLVRLPTGNGMALVFRHSAEELARCALEIAEGRKHLARRISRSMVRRVFLMCSRRYIPTSSGLTYAQARYNLFS